jgi:hypothetical protein
LASTITTRTNKNVPGMIAKGRPIGVLNMPPLAARTRRIRAAKIKPPTKHAPALGDLLIRITDRTKAKVEKITTNGNKT